MSWVRSLVVAATALSIALAPAAPALADTTATTGVTVTIEEVGALSVAFAQVGDGYVFRNAAGSAALSVSAVSGDTATATVRIAWSDTRSDATRTPFRLTLQADDLTSTEDAPGLGAPFVIDAGQVTIAAIGGTAATTAMSLDAPQTVFVSADVPTAGEQALDVVLRLEVPAGAFALTYGTTLRLSVAAADGGP